MAEHCSDNHSTQHDDDLVERARLRPGPGVAEMIEVFGFLSVYPQIVNVHPSQTRNATGGNVLEMPTTLAKNPAKRTRRGPEC